MGFHIHEHCTGGTAVLIKNNLDGRSKINYRNTAVDYLITKYPHDLGTGIILGSMHSLAGRSAAVCCDHGSVSILVKQHAEIVKPLNRLRTFRNQFAEQLGDIFEMSSAQCVDIVHSR